MEKRTGTVLSRKTAAPTSEFLSVPSAVCMYLQCFFQWCGYGLPLKLFDLLELILAVE